MNLITGIEPTSAIVEPVAANLVHANIWVVKSLSKRKLFIEWEPGIQREIAVDVLIRIKISVEKGKFHLTGS